MSSQPAQPHRLDSLRSMLHARSIAVVGASARTGSFGHRLTAEVLASPAGPDVHLVNPRGGEVRGLRCVPSLADVPAPVDLVLLGVPDSAAASQLRLAADRGDAGAVVFGTAPGQGVRLREIATDAGMALIGGGCMGFVNVQRGVRAVGYQERDEIPAGPVALVSHSGSAFSALLRTHR
ncbi:MAG: CoA-binding protein, partial [Actinomycetota bacterium]|nr:CoA-binding protein [Actinomycetota bacterium]